MSKTINPEKPILPLEEYSSELRSLYERQNKLTAAQKADDEELRALHREDTAARVENEKRDQVDALITGSSWEPPAATRDKISVIARRRELLVEAQRELAELIRQERIKASRLVLAEFQPEAEALAKEFWVALIPAIKIHSRFGAMKQRLESAGVDTSLGLYEFGQELLSHANLRTGYAASAMRDAVRRGYLKKSDCPAGYGIQ